MISPLRLPFRDYANAILHSYSEVYFLRGRLNGAVVLAISFLNPNAAVCGLIAILAAYAFARFINVDRSFLNSGFYTYNALLVGLAVGNLFRISPLTLFLVTAAGVLAFVVTMVMYNLFISYLKLPVFSLPFTLVTWATYLAAGRFSNLFVTGLYHRPHFNLDIHLPLVVSSFLKCLGTIMFLGDPLPGLLFAILLSFSSRILLLLAIGGYLTGTFTVGVLMGSLDIAFRDTSHFNFILIAMAVGGVFLVPSRRSYAIAMIAVMVSVIFLEAFKVFWAAFGVSGYSVPFNTPTYIITTMLFIYTLGLIRFPKMARFIRRTPEETLDYYLSDVLRYRGTFIGLALPFSGRWTVWQGCNSRWTHQGSQAYAYDFVIRDAEGRTYEGDGGKLTEYYAYNKPVLAPARGRILVVEKSLPDNPIGQVQRAYGWGNLIIMQDVWGNYICLGHLAQGSIRVTEGDWVERGALLGRCGNSGYSPQPHLHIQVQNAGYVGASTVPFSFVSYITGGRYRANELPAEGDEVEPCFPDKEQESRMTFMLDDRHRYQVFRRGKQIGELNLIVRCAIDGTFYLDSGRARLYIGSCNSTFYVYSMEGNDPWLRLIFLALPRMPLVVREGLAWADQIPIGVMVWGPLKSLLLLVASAFPSVADIRATLVLKNRFQIVGSVEYPLIRMSRQVQVDLETNVGLSRVVVDEWELRRINEAVRSSDV
ncbi:putative urea transporter [Azospirillaceae bacterium]